MSFMSFTKLQKLAATHGLTVRQCNKYHWRIEGGPFSVNYYANTQTVFVNGTTKGGKWCSAENAIQVALHGPDYQTPPAPRLQFSRAHNRRLLIRYPCCHWCSCPLTIDTATFEHVIPLSRGGTNHGDNVRLACEPCNKAKGNRIGPPPELAAK